MTFCDGVLKRIFATSIAIAIAVCMLGALAAAQETLQPRGEIFGGYSWLNPNGYVDWGKVPSIVSGWNGSGAFYLPEAHKVAFVIDGSGHYNSTRANVGLGLLGLQYKFRNDQFAPFVHVLVGASHLSPAALPSQWRAAVGGGGGFDLTLTKLIDWRIVQADYIYTSYNPQTFIPHNSSWNMVRLSTGIVFNLGSYYNPPLTCTASATPTEVFAPDPVTVTTTGSGFNPKHQITYGWATNGGRVSNGASQTATVDTTGVAAGSYAANSTITDVDPRFRHLDSGHHLNVWGKPDPIPPAKCTTNFTVKQPLPPVVSCSASPTTIATGDPATITMTATDPQGWPMTYSWSATGGRLSDNGTTATLTATTADAGKTITVTGTATTTRTGGNPVTQSSSCTAQVTVPPIISCVSIEDWGECTFEKNPKKPWRVDNDCKDVLDKVALRLQQNGNGKLQVVGFKDQAEEVDMKDIDGQRSVNVKYYLVEDELGPKADGSRIVPKQGGTKGKATHFYFVPDGSLCQGQVVEGTPVDESAVKGQSRAAKVPAPKKAKSKKAAAAPAQ
jgi:hypothetical protein